MVVYSRHQINARALTPKGPRIARIEESDRASEEALNRASPLKVLFLRAVERASGRASPARSPADQCSEARASPESVTDPVLVELATHICLWRIPGPPVQYMWTGPDHDLREQHADAVPLFDKNQRERVRQLGSRAAIAPDQSAVSSNGQSHGGKQEKSDE